ncbi:MAG: hypothetical protein J1F35_02370 [Erysipelotrichales bacterium]|nr:hypothetical protein [Erysipelotrichales bacterium]
MKIIDVTHEQYSNLEIYFDELSKVICNVERPCIIHDGDKKYLVNHFGTDVCIVEKQDDEVKSYVVDFGYKSIRDERFDIGNYSYYISSANGKSVTKVDYTNMNEYVLSSCPNEEENNMLVTFKQFAERTDKRLEFQYAIAEVTDIEQGIEYALTHNPDSIMLRTLKKSVENPYYREYLYKLGEDAVKYYRALISFGNSSFGVSPKTYTREDITKKLYNDGLYGSIPEDMSSLMMDKNEKYNELKLVAIEYANHVSR